MTTKKRYHERLFSGKCPNCGKPKTGNLKYCDECREYGRNRYRRNIGKSRPEKVRCKLCDSEIQVAKVGGIPKYCSNCKKQKNTESNRRWYSNPKNKKKRNKYSTEYARKWREENFRKYLNTWLNHRYGITLIDWISIYENQGGCCAICKKSFPNWETRGVIKRQIHLDHNHKTNAVRGLLCRSCNLAIGLLGDNPETVASALWYLSSFTK